MKQTSQPAALRKAAPFLAAGAGAGGAFQCWAMSGAAELREPHLPELMTLQAVHLRFFTSNHSRPNAATISTATTDHGVDEVGSSVGVVTAFASGAFGVDEGFALGKLVVEVLGASTADDLGGVTFASSASIAVTTSLPLSDS